MRIEAVSCTSAAAGSAPSTLCASRPCRIQTVVGYASTPSLPANAVSAGEASASTLATAIESSNSHVNFASVSSSGSST